MRSVRIHRSYWYGCDDPVCAEQLVAMLQIVVEGVEGAVDVVHTSAVDRLVAGTSAAGTWQDQCTVVFHAGSYQACSHRSGLEVRIWPKTWQLGNMP